MKRVAVALLAAALLVTVVAALAAVGAWRTVHQPYQGFPGDEIAVSVPPGSDARAILEELERRGVIRSALLGRAYLAWALDRPSLKAGEYHFVGPASLPQVLEKLTRGAVITYPVTIVEGLTAAETVELLAEAGFGDAELLTREVASPARISDLDPEAEDLEGYLFPDTYRFARGTSEAAMIDTLVRTYRRRVGEIASADGEPLDHRRLVTLASIVEKEAQLQEERPVIAGVYANRIRRGMLLQADPTVIFALKRRGEWDGNLRRDDLRLDSPYNTYRYPGLPPGPICSPGLASLRAAAQPESVPYLFFVSRNDGSHVFSTTLREHNRNVERWQRQYWRERWARERQQKADN